MRVVIGDTGYDSDAIVAKVRGLRARVVIPPLKCRAPQRRYSRRPYRGRNAVERLWGEVKPYRRVATRYDKLDASFVVFVHLASVFTVLKHP